MNEWLGRDDADADPDFYGQRSPWMTLLYWLISIYCLVGAGGGVWYISHRAAEYWGW